MADKKPGSMVIHLDDAQMLRMLSDKDRGRLFLALIDYAQEGRLPEGFKGALAMSFDVMRRAIDRNVLRYNETCERNRARANMRWHPEDAHACPGMPAHTPDANSNRNQTVIPNENQNLTETPADTKADTAADTAAETAAQAAATAQAAIEAQISFACARKRELLGRLMRGDKAAREELNHLEIKLSVLQAELDRQRGQ